MFRIQSLARLKEIGFNEYPLLVRSEFAVNGSERIVYDQDELLKAVLDALEASPTSYATIFEMPVSLGEMIECLHRDTALYSGSQERRNHPNFLRIVEKGDVALRYILIRMAAGECRLEFLMLLREMTGTNPVSPEHRGNMKQMRQDWLEWAKQHGKLDDLAAALM